MRIGLILFCLAIPLFIAAQDSDKYIHSKEGTTIGFKKQLVLNCKNSYGAPAGNNTIRQICECQVELLDYRFSVKQIKSYGRKYKESALLRLIEEDTVLQRQIRECASGSKGLRLFEIPEYRKSFIEKCANNLVRADKPLDDTLARLFCSCAADVLESRKMPLEKLEELNDPSSFLYNEVAYKCGSPYLKPSDFALDWKPTDSSDISGPADVDSVQVISIMGMHKVKITIGKETRIWLLDSGASDLLISDDFLRLLKQQKVISEMDFAGEGHYRLADNSIITCKRYKIDKVIIGKFTVHNIIIASSRETKEFLAGKSLLNKFSQWILDNKNNWLILKK